MPKFIRFATIYFFIAYSHALASPQFVPLSQQLLNDKLSASIHLGKLEKIEALLKKGANPRNLHNKNKSPLYKAIDFSYPAIVSILLQYDKTKIETQRFNTLLVKAIENKKAEIVDLLLQHDNSIQIHLTTLLSAAKSGNEKIFNQLRHKGAKLLRAKNSSTCLLEYAIQGNNPAIVARFIEAGITPDKECDQSFRLATDLANFEIIKQLLQAKANIDGVNDSRGNTLNPLQTAIRYGRLPMVKYLLESGAQLRRKDKEDKPLILAAEHGHADVLAYLLDQNSQAVDLSLLAIKASEYAWSQGHLAVLKLLKERGVNFQNLILHPKSYPSGVTGSKISTTALHFAASIGHFEMVRYLLEQGQDVNAKETSADDPNVNRTALLYAAENGSYLIVNLLLEKGADVNHLDPEKGTALLLASKNSYLGIVKLLINKGAKHQVWHIPNLPLHEAVKKGNYPLVSYLLTNDWEKKALFHYDSKNQQGKTALHIASEQGHAGIVQLLLNHAAKPNNIDNEGNTALHLAAFDHEIYPSLLARQQQINVINNAGDTPLARAIIQTDGFYSAQLIQKKANIHLKNKQQQTLLHLLAISNLSYKTTFKADTTPKQQLLLLTSRDIAPRVEWILQHGIDINAVDTEGNTALHYLVDSFVKAKFIKRLLKEKPKLDLLNRQQITPLYKAIDNFQTDNAILLLKAGANPNIGNINEKTPLHLAIQQGNTALVKSLLTHGANVNLQDTDGKSTLFALVDSRASIEIIDLLVKAGADINKVDKEGNNIIQALAESMSKDAALPRLQTMLTLGANPNVHNQKMETPLHHAILSHAPNSAKLLLKNKANPNAQDKDGVTPLHYAVRTHAFKQLRQLLKYKAKTNFYNRFGKTPLHLAVEQNDDNMLQILLSAGANISSMDKDLRTPLITAIALDHQPIALQLINQGANINATSKGGWQALHFAVDNANVALCKILLAKGANPHNKIWRGDSAITLAKQASSKNHQAILTLLENHKPTQQPNSLERAISTQDIKMVKLYLHQGSDINSQSSIGKSALHLAIESLDVQAVQQFLQQKAEPNLLDHYKQSPLEKAILVAYQDVDKAKQMISLLLDNGADINHYNRHSEVPLLLAIRENISADIATLLLAKGAVANVHDYFKNTPLLEASQSAKPEIISALLQAGATVNQTNLYAENALHLALAPLSQNNLSSQRLKTTMRKLLDPSKRWSDLAPPQSKQLKNQAIKRYTEVASLLIKQGINTASKNHTGYTPLDLAVHANNITITQALLEKPAQQTGRSNALIPTLLAYAMDQEFLKLSDLLLNYYATPIDDKIGKKLLYSACHNHEQFAPIVKRLLEKGAKQHLKDPEFSLSLLITATEHGAVKTLRLLTKEYGLNLLQNFNYQAIEQQNLLFVAVRNKKIKTIDFLLKAGIAIDNRDEKYNSVLNYSALLDHYETAKLLLESQANPNIGNGNGETALDLVHKIDQDNNNPLRITRLLFQYGAKIEFAKNPLIAALKDGNQTLAAFYIDELKQDISKLIKGESALHIVLSSLLDPLNNSKAYQQQFSLVDFLLQRGADANLAANTASPSSNYQHIKYPLEMVLNHPKIIALLLQHGAKADSVNQQGQGLVQQLIRKTDTKLSINSLQLLIKAGAEVDKQDENGNTALFSLFSESIFRQQPANVLSQKLQLLLQYGDAIQLKNKMGETAFSMALASVGHPVANPLILTLIPHLKTIENKSTGYGKPPAIIVACKQPKLLSAFLKQGADINSTMETGETCLHRLMQPPFSKTQFKTIEYVLEQGANINQQDHQGNTALHHLMRSYNNSYLSDEQKEVYYLIVKFLLQNKPNLELLNDQKKGGKTPLLLAKNNKILRLLIQHGANINVQDNEGNTLLQITENENIAKTLVEMGIDLEHINQHGETALFTAVKQGNNKLIKLLLAHKAKTNIRDHERNSLLHIVSSDTLAQQLIKQGVEVNLRNQYAETPLHTTKSLQIATTLLEYHANPNLQNQYGQTALHLACRDENQSDIANLLIDYGSNIKLKDQYDETALFKTAYNNQKQLAKKLIEKGAEITSSNKLGDTPLHIALASNNKQVAELLIINPAINLNQTNWEKKTPLEFSLDNFNNFGISKLLIAKGATPSDESIQRTTSQDGNPFWLQRALKDSLAEVATQFLIPSEKISHDEIKRRVILREFGSNRTNLQIAASLGAKQLIAPMLAHGAQINRVNSLTQTPLLLAVINQHIETAKALLQQGANLSAIDNQQNNVLHLAAHSEQAAMLDMLLNLKDSRLLDINALNKSGDTALHIAARNEDIASIKVLLKHKINVNVVNKQQMTSLLIASQKINAAMIPLLLNHKADVKIRNKEGYTPLLLMLQQHIYRNNNENTAKSHQAVISLIETFLEYGAKLEITAKDGRTALHMAVPILEIAHYLLDKGSNIHALDKEKNTPLFHSARASNGNDKSAEITTRLLTMGSDIKHKNIWGETALHKAIRAENYSAINLLIDQGADVNASNKGGYTPLLNVVHSYNLALKNKTVLINKLIQKKADINKTDKSKNSALHIALMDKRDQISQLLLKHHININLQNNHGKTALHLLAMRKSSSITSKLIQQLINQQAQLNLRDANSNTPLHLAVKANAVTTVQLLIANKAKINLSNTSGNTPLHLAAKQKSSKLIQLLLKYPVRINAKNNLGNTALHIAGQQQNMESIKYLLTKNANTTIKNYTGNTPYLGMGK